MCKEDISCHFVQAYGSEDLYIYSFLTLTLDEDECGQLHPTAALLRKHCPPPSPVSQDVA